MKSFLIGMMIIALSNSKVLSQNLTLVDSNYVFKGYTDRVELFNKMPIRKGAIVFVGNSLTEAGRWNDIAPDLPILNRGISGDITFGVYARLNEILRHSPSKIFLMIGVNDLKKSIPAECIINNYSRIVNEILRVFPKSKIYLCSVLPINKFKLIESFKTVTNEKVEELNVALNKLSADNGNVQFVNFHTILADSDGQLRGDITSDGIHLEVSAYIEMVDYLKRIKAI